MNKNDNTGKGGKSGNDQGSTKKDFNRDSGGKPNSISNTAPPPRRPPPKSGSDDKK